MHYRSILMALAMCTLTTALSAQAEERFSLRDNDTSITIERGDRGSCRVVIDGRTLSKEEAARYCTSRQFAFSTRPSDGRGRSFSFDSIRSAARLFNGFDSLFSARPIIGVTIDSRARETDRFGAYIVAVTPSGPADKAGLQSGDIITRIAGKSLTTGATRRSVDADESRPYVRLIEAMASVEAGKEIALDYRRGDANLSTKVTPREDDQFFAWGRSSRSFDEAMDRARRSMFRGDSTAPSSPYFGNTPRIPGRPMPGYGYGSGYGSTVGNILGSTELAPLNEKLGRYFGASTGVLVIDADAGNTLGLQPGDVVQSIGGRSISSPSEFGRVLRSYSSGDRLSIGVVRDKQKLTLTPTLP